MMVAVRVAKPELKQRIIDSLKHPGAKDIESAQGAWENKTENGWTSTR